MATDFPIRCSCGSVQGIARGLSPRAGSRILCYCDDCQALAYFLGREHELLDEQGGTDIFLTSPARLEFTQGLENLANVRLTGKGSVRWYTACCNTPIGNAPPTNKWPYVGLIHHCLQADGGKDEVDTCLGPVRARVFTQFAQGDPTALEQSRGAMFGMVARLLAVIVKGKLAGDHRSNPFYDPQSGQSRIEPRTLSEAERKELYGRLQAGT